MNQKVGIGVRMGLTSPRISLFGKRCGLGGGDEGRRGSVEEREYDWPSVTLYQLDPCP